MAGVEKENISQLIDHIDGKKQLYIKILKDLTLVQKILSFCRGPYTVQHG